MPKGFERSRSRGVPATRGVVRLRIPIKNLEISVDGSTGTGYGTAVIGALPEGDILFLGASLHALVFDGGSDANLADDWDGDYSLGSAGTNDGTLSGPEVDYIVSHPINGLPGSKSTHPADARHDSTTTGMVVDNTDGTKTSIFLNVLIDNADISGVVTLKVTGHFTMIIVTLGDD